MSLKMMGFYGYRFTLRFSKLWRIQMQHQRLWVSEHRRSFHVEHEVCSPDTHCLYIMFSLPPKCIFLIKMKQLTCKIIVLMFLALEKIMFHADGF